jgi:hypothetical protein
MAQSAYYDNDGNYVDPYDTDPYAPYDTAPTYPNPTAPTPLNTDPYAGGMTMAGWSPQGGAWVPIYTGSDGRYYTGGGMPWWGPKDSLRTGDGAGGKPTWAPGQPEPASATQSYPQSVAAANTPVAPAPGTSMVPSSGGGSGTPTAQTPFAAPAPSQFNFPQFDAPDYTPVDPFKAPSLQDAQNEPGYAFAMEQGRKALENSAAAKGVLRTGGTLKDLFSWGDQFGEQNYAESYNRSANAWGLSNKANLDQYDIKYKGAHDEFSAKEGAAKATFADLFNRWQATLDANTRLATNTSIY